MKSTFGATKQTLTVLLAAGLLAVLSTPSLAVPINYGDFEGTDVWYLQVTEDANSADDETPLFGPPTVSNNSIDFDPVGFNAASTNADTADTTDGNLRFDIEAKDGKAINNLTLTEAGDTTLAGFGTDATFASVTTNVFIDVFEVDGVGIDQFNIQGDLVFTPSDGNYGLATDGGGGPSFNTAWTGELFINLKQELIDRDIPFQGGVTQLSVNLDNTLIALSEDGTSSLIAKKDADGVVIITNIPEPATVAMALCGLVGLALAGRRRS